MVLRWGIRGLVVARDAGIGDMRFYRASSATACSTSRDMDAAQSGVMQLADAKVLAVEVQSNWSKFQRFHGFLHRKRKVRFSSS